MERLLLFSLSLVLLANLSYAQSAKYQSAMEQNVSILDTAHTLSTLVDLGNRFERIADAEKTVALPYYYAAYCKVMTAFLGNDNAKADEVADKAEEFISKSESLDKPNSETYVIRSMIATAHMMVDPQNRYMQYGAASAEALNKSIQLDSTNPRPVYLQGQAKFYTPEAFGGGKSVAKPIFEKALVMFGTFKPASDIAPRWGKGSTQYFLSQCN
jgi:hypothetical protein